MKCKKARKLISDHVDHLLEGKTEEMLLAHLSGCDACRDIYDELTVVVNDTKKLSRIRLAGDVWPAVQSQMAWEKRKTDFRYTWKYPGLGFLEFPVKPALSFAMVLLVVGLISFAYFNSPFGPMHTDNAEFPERTALTHFKEAESHYELAIHALNAVVEDERSALPPELITVFEQNLEIIDASIKKYRMVIQEHPESIEANNYLLICYKKKMDLLNDMRELILQSS